jgi:hypothetical protein
MVWANIIAPLGIVFVLGVGLAEAVLKDVDKSFRVSETCDCSARFREDARSQRVRVLLFFVRPAGESHPLARLR